jgi:primary-amine oxidase
MPTLGRCLLALQMPASHPPHPTTMLQVNMEQMADGPSNPHGNGFYATETELVTEEGAKRLLDPVKARYWKVKNPSVKHPVTGEELMHFRAFRYDAFTAAKEGRALVSVCVFMGWQCERVRCASLPTVPVSTAGKPVAWKLVPLASPAGLLSTPTSGIAQRIGFATKNLWVTPHSDEERWPAGTYTVQSEGGEGLPQWTAQVRGCGVQEEGWLFHRRQCVLYH